MCLLLNYVIHKKCACHKNLIQFCTTTPWKGQRSQTGLSVSDEDQLCCMKEPQMFQCQTAKFYSCFECVHIQICTLVFKQQCGGSSHIEESIYCSSDEAPSNIDPNIDI